MQWNLLSQDEGIWRRILEEECERLGKSCGELKRISGNSERWSVGLIDMQEITGYESGIADYLSVKVVLLIITVSFLNALFSKLNVENRVLP